MSQYPATTAGVAGGNNATTTGFATDVEQNTVHTTTTTAAAPASRGKVHTSAKPVALLPLLGLAFLSLILYLSGLAALQSQCNRDYSLVGQTASDTAWLNGVSGFSSAVLPCSKLYRWSWFCMAFEVVILLGLLISTVMGRLWHSRLAMLALFAIATVLFMLQSERFLTMTSVVWYEGGVWKHRANVTTAGAIMLVVSNILIMLAIGIDRLVDHTGQATEGYGHGHATKV